MCWISDSFIRTRYPMHVMSTEKCRFDRFLQMEREFSSPRALMGKVTLVGTVSEYLPFIFSKRLLARVGPRRYACFWGSDNFTRCAFARFPCPRQHDGGAIRAAPLRFSNGRIGPE